MLLTVAGISATPAREVVDELLVLDAYKRVRSRSSAKDRIDLQSGIRFSKLLKSFLVRFSIQVPGIVSPSVGPSATFPSVICIASEGKQRDNMRSERHRAELA